PTQLDVAMRPSSIMFRAKDPGSWGREIAITVGVNATKASVLSFDASAKKATLSSSANGFYPDAWVEVDNGTTKGLYKVTAVNGAGLEFLSFAAADFTPPSGGTTTVSVLEMKLTVTWGSVNEEFDGLALENVPGHYIVDRLQNSTLIEVVTPLPSDTS